MCSCMEERSSVALSPAEGTTDARSITSQGGPLPCDYAWKNNLPCLARLVGTKPFRTIRWRQTFEQRSIMYSYLPSLAVNPPPPSKRCSSALIYISMSTVLVMSLGGVKCSSRTHGSRSHPSFPFPVLPPPPPHPHRNASTGTKAVLGSKKVSSLCTHPSLASSVSVRGLTISPATNKILA